MRLEGNDSVEKVILFVVFFGTGNEISFVGLQYVQNCYREVFRTQSHAVPTLKYTSGVNSLTLTVQSKQWVLSLAFTFASAAMIA